MIFASTIEILQILQDVQGIAEPLLFLLAIIVINIKYIKIKIRDRPLAHNLLIIGLSGWLLYTIMDYFLYDIARAQFQIGDPVGVFTGYSAEYNLLTQANILRDFAIFGAMVMNWTFLMVAYSIMDGEELTRERFLKNKLVIAVEIISTIIMVFGDQITITVSEEWISVSAFTKGLGSIFVYIAIAFYVIAALFLITMFIKSRKQTTDRSIRRRITVLSWGILIMGIGHVFWAVLGYLKTVIPIWFADPINASLMSIIGHLLWMLSPILIIFGVKKRPKS